MLAFPETFPGSKRVDLNINYRRNVDKTRNEGYSFYKDKNNRIIEKMRRTNGRKRG